MLRPGLQTVDSTVRLTALALTMLDSEPLIGRLWIVEEHRIRIRGTDTGTTP